MAYNLLVFEKGGKMKKSLISVSILLLMFVFANAYTEMADVTGDGVDDDIRIGEQSVVVVDGASGKRHVIIAKISDPTVNISEFHPGYFTDEIAVTISSGRYTYYTYVYTYHKGKFRKVSDKLRGMPCIIDDEIIPWLFEESFDIYEDVYPITLDYSNNKRGIITEAELTDEINDEIVIEEVDQFEKMIKVPKGYFMVYIFRIEDGPIYLTIRDERGETIDDGKFETGDSFYSFYSNDGPYDENTTLKLVNQNLLRSKKAVYIIKWYEQSSVCDFDRAMERAMEAELNK